MSVIAVRLVIVWVILTCMVRLMGKRQIGEMQMSELVTAFMLSELATLPVTDTGIPLLFSIVPIVLVSVLEILSSFAFLHAPFLSRLVSGTPVVLIRMGEIDRRALRAARMTLSELMGELRQKDVPDPEDVAYAILEENGRLSVIPRAMMKPPDAKTLSKPVRERGICHVLIADGVVSVSGLSLSGYTEEGVEQLLADNGIDSPKDVYLMTVNDMGECRIVREHDNVPPAQSDNAKKGKGEDT